jgi:glucokinase
MYIGLDIGGTKIRGGLLDRRFRLVKTKELLTEAYRGQSAVRQNIFQLIRELDHKKTKKIGVAIRGLVDSRRGQVKTATMMPDGFRNVGLVQLIKKEFQVSVCIDNDANCFTLAESKLGAGRGKNTVVGVTLGTGIGGGIIINGQIYHGARGAAGELGHIIIKPDSYKWNCGQRGCFESLCSGSALTKQYYLLTKKKLNSFAIEDRYRRGDKSARKVFAAMSHYLALGLANIVQLLNPDIMVIGGGFSRLKFYVKPALEEFKKHVMYDELKKTPIRYAKLGPQAGVIGAALLCLNK